MALSKSSKSNIHRQDLFPWHAETKEVRMVDCQFAYDEKTNVVVFFVLTFSIQTSSFESRQMDLRNDCLVGMAPLTTSLLIMVASIFDWLRLPVKCIGATFSEKQCGKKKKPPPSPPYSNHIGSSFCDLPLSSSWWVLMPN